jgi:hypothetical protein
MPHANRVAGRTMNERWIMLAIVVAIWSIEVAIIFRIDRRPWRFSLRTMLLAITLLAIVMAIVGTLK